MTDIIDVLQGVKRIGISGHLRPDGDCLGSCTALYTYLVENIKDTEIFVFLERVPENFMYLPNVDKIITDYPDLEPMDVMICLDSSDLDGIIDQLRVTEGVEVAILLNETEKGVYKVSMRSNNDVNVSEIAVSFGGGGHIKAAGCSISGSVEEITQILVDKIKKQL